MSETVQIVARNASYQEFRSSPPSYVHLSPEEVTSATPAPSQIKWCGRRMFLPAIDAMVHVRINRIGLAKVTGYFTEGGYLGLLAKPIKPPKWYVKQNGADAECHVFGTEIDELIDCPRCGRKLRTLAEKHYVTFQKPVYSPLSGSDTIETRKLCREVAS